MKVASVKQYFKAIFSSDDMSQSDKSPSYNILAPKPWTSFKETPPSPLLVLQRRDSRTGLPRRSVKKNRAPQPPVRTSSLNSAGSGADSDGEGATEVFRKTEVVIKTSHQEEEIILGESFKNEVSILVTKESTAATDTVDETDATTKTEQSELVLDVKKLPGLDVTEDIADNEGETSAIDDEVPEPVVESVEEEDTSKGKRLSILGLSNFVEGLSSLFI